MLTEQYDRAELKETWSITMEVFISIFVFAELLVSICAGHGRQELKQKPKLTASEIFDLRTKCQDVVDKDVKNGLVGVVGDALVSDVAAHYNPVTNRCYAKVAVWKNFVYGAKTVQDNYLSWALYDAQSRNLILVANRAGNITTGQDLRKENVDSSFDAVTGEIKSLMAQEQTEN